MNATDLVSATQTMDKLKSVAVGILRQKIPALYLDEESAAKLVDSIISAAVLKCALTMNEAMNASTGSK